MDRWCQNMEVEKEEKQRGETGKFLKVEKQYNKETMRIAVLTFDKVTNIMEKPTVHIRKEGRKKQTCTRKRKKVRLTSKKLVPDKLTNTICMLSKRRIINSSIPSK